MKTELLPLRSSLTFILDQIVPGRSLTQRQVVSVSRTFEISCHGPATLPEGCVTSSGSVQQTGYRGGVDPSYRLKWVGSWRPACYRVVNTTVTISSFRVQ